MLRLKAVNARRDNSWYGDKRVCVRGHLAREGDFGQDVGHKLVGSKAALVQLLQPAYCKCNCLKTIEDNNCKLQNTVHKL